MSSALSFNLVDQIQAKLCSKNLAIFLLSDTQGRKSTNISRVTHQIPLLSFLFTFSGEGKWLRNIDYYRLDGSTTAQSRKKWAEEFNDETNVRYGACSNCIDILNVISVKLYF